MSSAGNVYNVSSDLSLQGFDLSPEKAIVAFVLAALNYIIILFCNCFLLFTIITNKALHEPMYILLLNLPINDLIGSTCLFPHIMRELLFDTRTMSFSICITQAFFIHVYAVSVVFILTAMAYDRYVAICQPMRYTTIMSNNKSSDTRSKALQTCGTHLIVFILFECLGLFTIISYRIKDISPHLRKFIAVAAMILPPTMNPVIYGLRTKEIRVKGITFFKQKVFAS
ncbi:hypothetical protein PO909_003011 [Leuciscus waleckii]